MYCELRYRSPKSSIVPSFSSRRRILNQRSRTLNHQLISLKFRLYLFVIFNLLIKLQLIILCLLIYHSFFTYFFVLLSPNPYIFTWLCLKGIGTTNHLLSPTLGTPRASAQPRHLKADLEHPQLSRAKSPWGRRPNFYQASQRRRPSQTLGPYISDHHLILPSP